MAVVVVLWLLELLGLLEPWVWFRIWGLDSRRSNSPPAAATASTATATHSPTALAADGRPLAAAPGLERLVVGVEEEQARSGVGHPAPGQIGAQRGMA